MQDIYKGMYGSDKKLDLSQNPRVKIMSGIIDRLQLKNKNILDIGCYDGTLLSLIKNRDNNFYGVEASDYGTKESTRKGIKVTQFLFDDKAKIPFEDNFFDIIIAGEIIEHIFDTDFFLSEIKRILKKTGFFLISTPNVASLGRRLMLFLGRNPIIEVSPNEADSSGHIRYFTFKTLQNLLEKHNFKIIAFKSDVINLSFDGKIKLLSIPRLLFGLGQSIIYLCKNKFQLYKPIAIDKQKSCGLFRITYARK